MNLYHYPDHVVAALRTMLAQDRGRERLEALTALIVQRIQYLEDVVWQIRENANLDTATGFDLDRLGGIVGELRQGRGDELYRLWIRARAAVNRSSGTPDEMLTILRLVLPSTAGISYQNIPDRNAEAYFVLSDVGATDLTQVKRILEEAVGAGILLNLILAVDPSEAFSFQGGPGLGFNQGKFSNVL